ncbi:MAG: phytoene/squalene synthase family protein [Planctomycetaceae bacterium]|nr:phytoene/squalene synthase family protein [Planctomycetales bacterium]MCB9938763.1 phytoene/squalene synthase family protein [Planctomycetaceae bacterium]
MTHELKDAYRHCEQLASASASSFFWSFRLLPREQRQAMCALYAFSRHTDDLADGDLADGDLADGDLADGDLADGDLATDVRRAHLDAWRCELRDALNGNCHSPLWRALHDTTVRFAIPHEYLVAIVDGVAMDLSPPCYDTFDDLNDYCYHVASAVGLACIHIFGFEDDRAEKLAETCGVAFQLTNILRDLCEDAAQGRVYLPRKELADFDCHPNDFRQGEMNAQVRELMHFQIARAERLYDEAASLATLLHPRGRRAFVLMFSTYRTLLAEIKRRDGDVFTRRVRLGSRGKLKAVMAALQFRAPSPAHTDDESKVHSRTRKSRDSRRVAVRQSGN